MCSWYPCIQANNVSWNNFQAQWVSNFQTAFLLCNYVLDFQTMYRKSYHRGALPDVATHRWALFFHNEILYNCSAALHINLFRRNWNSCWTRGNLLCALFVGKRFLWNYSHSAVALSKLSLLPTVNFFGRLNNHMRMEYMARTELQNEAGFPHYNCHYNMF